MLWLYLALYKPDPTAKGQMQNHSSWSYVGGDTHDWNLCSLICLHCAMSPQYWLSNTTAAKVRSDTLETVRAELQRTKNSLEEPDAPLMPKTLTPSCRVDQISLFILVVGTTEADVCSLPSSKLSGNGLATQPSSIHFLSLFPFDLSLCLRYRCEQILHWSKKENVGTRAEKIPILRETPTFSFLGNWWLPCFTGHGNSYKRSIELGVCLVSEIRSITFVAESGWYIALEQ